MPDYLLDCNDFSAVLRKVSAVRERIQLERKAGNRFISCYPVLCELEAGIQQTTKLEENRRRLTQFLRHVRLWPIDNDTSRIYGSVFIELRGRGRALSQVDMFLGALALQHGLIVLTTDRDFEAISQLRYENWVV
jgi:tRNA(fMet)-specific endonuclease VapC